MLLYDNIYYHKTDSKRKGENMFLYLFWAFFALLMLIAIYLGWKIAKTDLRRRIIPDAYLFPLMVIGALAVTFFPWPISIQEGIIGMTFGYIVSTVTGIVFDKILRRKNPKADTPIGMGDIKLISVGGLWVGPRGLAIALVLACVFGIIWAYRKRQKFIPFAPFFILGTFLAFISIAFLI